MRFAAGGHLVAVAAQAFSKSVVARFDGRAEFRDILPALPLRIQAFVHGDHSGFAGGIGNMGFVVEKALANSVAAFGNVRTNASGVFGAKRRGRRIGNGAGCQCGSGHPDGVGCIVERFDGPIGHRILREGA